ncbi:hypothetical protein KP79_PYT03419 [Mizuhopecten yessoensis]|uniref:Uncharacterized protein n=1 Tax=Mizuhopecten yessoensis TaxID=6573 RepID=A0A210PDC9_MIZYE|nr:hypothetical protein KP79_PYT03419 [Mizuhopecten yessoensis]
MFVSTDNFQMVALLTNIDKASQSAATVEEMLESREMCNAVKQIHECVGLPVNCIFAIYNYHKQLEKYPEMDKLILHTLRCLLERLSDIYDRRKRVKVVPPEKQKNRPE